MRPIDNDDIVTFDQKCADFAQMLFSDHPRSFEFRRRAQYGKTKWIAGNKAVKHRLVELLQIVANVRKRILMTQTQITGRVTGIHIQVHEHRRLVFPRAKRRKIQGGGRGSYAAFDSNEGVHPAKLPALAVHALQMFFEASHRIVEFRALQRLLKEIGAAHTHGPQQELFAQLHTGKNRVERWRRLSHLFKNPQTLFGIRRDVQQYTGLRIHRQVMCDAHGEIRSHIVMVADDFRIRSTRELLADEIMKTGFRARDDQLNSHNSSKLPGCNWIDSAL